MIIKAEAQNSAPFPEQCQIVCNYKLTFRPDSTDLSTKSDEMRLLIGKSVSKFESIGSSLVDSLYNAMISTPGGEEKTTSFLDKRMTISKSRFTYKIYKYPKKTVSYEKIEGKLYQYQEEMPLFNWKMSSQKATIAGYACQKATTSFAGRIWEAWFTREVPVPDGPYKFSSLPGLIIKVGDTKQQYVFELTGLYHPKRSIAITLPNATIISSNKKAVLLAQRNHYENLPNMVGAISKQSINEKQDLRSSLKKKFNNSLEIK